MSDYGSEKDSCTCDSPTGSESRRCSYCRNSSYVEPTKNRKKKMAQHKPSTTKKSGNGSHRK